MPIKYLTPLLHLVILPSVNSKLRRVNEEKSARFQVHIYFTRINRLRNTTEVFAR